MRAVRKAQTKGQMALQFLKAMTDNMVIYDSLSDKLPSAEIIRIFWCLSNFETFLAISTLTYLRSGFWFSIVDA